MTMTMSNTEDQTRFETDPYLLTQIDPTLNDDRSIGYESDKSVNGHIQHKNDITYQESQRQTIFCSATLPQPKHFRFDTYS